MNNAYDNAATAVNTIEENPVNENTASDSMPELQTEEELDLIGRIASAVKDGKDPTEEELFVEIEGFEKEDFNSDKPYLFILSNHNDNEILYKKLKNKLLEQAHIRKYGRRNAADLLKSFEAKHPDLLPCVVKAPVNVSGSGFTGIERFFDNNTVNYGNYECSDNGIIGTTINGAPVLVCGHPIIICKRNTNIISNIETVDVAYVQDGEWKIIRQIPRSDIASTQKIVPILASRGINVTSESAKNLVTFLSTFDQLNRPIIPRAKTTDVIGWMSDGSFVPFNGNIEVDAMSSDKDLSSMASALHKAGDAQTWIDAINEKRKLPNSVPMRMMIAGSLASVLVEPMHRLPFWMHMRGKRDTGKTVTMRVASTVWGKAELNDGWMRTMLGTDVGFEMLAGFARNLPLCLNELQVAQRADKSFAETVYKLCEGSGKIRGSRSGGLQRTRSWRLVTLSCGEDQIITSEEKGGANTRVIEINLQESIYDDPQTFCSNILDKHYGHAGPMFIEGLKNEDFDALTDEWLTISKAWTATGKARKQADAGALLMVADRLAEKYIFKDGVRLTDNDILQYLKSEDATDDDLSCFDALQSLISAKHRNFSRDGMKPDGDCWGRIKDETIYNPATDKNETYMYVFFDKKYCDPELKHMGYDVQRFVEWAKEHGYLITKPDAKPGREYVQQKKLYTGANGSWCYVFKIKYEGDDDVPKADSKPVQNTVYTPEPEQMNFTDVTSETESELPF